MLLIGYSCPSSIDCIHWSLKQSISQSHKGTVIKFVITVTFNISTRKCNTKTTDKHKHFTMQLYDTAFEG